jgi:hypothetical protein
MRRYRVLWIEPSGAIVATSFQQASDLFALINVLPLIIGSLLPEQRQRVSSISIEPDDISEAVAYFGGARAS